MAFGPPRPPFSRARRRSLGVGPETAPGAAPSVKRPGAAWGLRQRKAHERAPGSEGLRRGPAVPVGGNRVSWPP
jgi:hypothetical protein